MGPQVATPPHTAAVRIEPPADFPVVWRDAQDAERHWLQDRMHTPEPLLPLEQALWNLCYEGFNAAAAAYAMPTRVDIRYVNAYLYMTPRLSVSDDEMDAQSRLADEKMDEAMDRLRMSWEREWLPEIRAHIAWWDAFDLAGASRGALLAHLQESAARLLRLWEIHFRIVLPTYMAMSQFDDLHRDLFADRDAFASYRLLQGFDNKTLEATRALWALSREARAPEVRRALAQSPASAALAALAESAPGRQFRVALDAYLREYGMRADSWGVRRPAWIEDPAPVLKNLQDCLAHPERDPGPDEAARAAEREQAVADARQALQSYPRPIRARYEFLLRAAQTGVVLSEDHGFWIDFNATYRVRRLALECGRRLVDAGVMVEPEDALYLTLDEMAAALAGACGAAVAIPERREQIAWARTVAAPPALGTDLGPPPDTPLTRFFGKFFGQPAAVSEDTRVLNGAAGSPGKTRGRAKVVRSLSEAGKLHAGDVLVTAATAPPWTPLFATAGAVVTDTGGILSHCAVVAREYRLPAVVGTGRATAVIRDGQLVEVDGDAGVVRILAE